MPSWLNYNCKHYLWIDGLLNHSINLFNFPSTGLSNFPATNPAAGLLKADLKMDAVADHMNGTGGSQGGSSGRSSPSGEGKIVFIFLKNS